MAAPSDAHSPALVPLRDIRPSDLDLILEEEERAWWHELDWNFRPSADLVRRFVGMRALNGHALWLNSRAIGYCYHVSEDRKGLIGDIYVLREFASPDHENLLLAAAVSSMMESPFVRRIESQLMMLRDPFRRELPHPEFLSRHTRNFMRTDLAAARRLPPGKAAHRILLEPWSEAREEDAARLIAAAYEGHIDGEINDQYKSVPGARRFLTNIVQFPGCGTFFQPASFLALDPRDGVLTGLCLSSLVADNVGHLTQVCVAPQARATGIGYELMRRSLAALADHGCDRVSLTVTAANLNAVTLYERMGFYTHRLFAAYVWEAF
jgi:ribosomal protein S18 acetylase RimI-like enzyme